jgi:hypothetical protein
LMCSALARVSSKQATPNRVPESVTPDTSVLDQLIGISPESVIGMVRNTHPLRKFAVAQKHPFLGASTTHVSAPNYQTFMIHA